MKDKFINQILYIHGSATLFYCIRCLMSGRKGKSTHIDIDDQNKTSVVAYKVTQAPDLTLNLH